MNQIKVHVIAYDEINNSIVVVFESDVASNTAPLVYQMHNVQGSSITEKMSNIAKSGVYTVEALVEKEKQLANVGLKDGYKALVGSAVSYSKQDLFPQSSNTVLVSNLTDVTNS